ncbi:Wzz/FepE/Etk N-terminal domain-containing protein [Flavobacterium hauense]
MEEIKNSDEITLKSIIAIIKDWYLFLLSKFKIIMLIAFLGACLGVAYSYMKKPIYTATLTFALEDEKSSGMGGALGLAGQFGIDIGGGGGGVFSASNLIELFKSRSMVEKTLLTPVYVKGKNISLAEMYIRQNEWRKRWEGKPKFRSIQFVPNAERINFTRDQDSILEVMYKDLSGNALNISQKDKKASIISVEVKTKNEEFSKLFAESLVGVVSDFYIEIKSGKAEINMVILQKQLDSIRGELNGSIQSVALANDRTFSLNPALNVKRVPSVRKNVDVQTNTAILTELVRQTELAKVTLRKETPLIQVIDKPIYPLKKERFGKAMGVIYGGFIGGFLAAIYLIVRRLYKILMAE